MESPDFFLGGSAANSPAGPDNKGVIRGVDGATGASLFDTYGIFTNDNFGSNPIFVPGDLNGDGVNDVVGKMPGADSTEGANDNIGAIRALNGLTGAVLYTVYMPSPGDSVIGIDSPGDLGGVKHCP